MGRSAPDAKSQSDDPCITIKPAIYCYCYLRPSNLVENFVNTPFLQIDLLVLVKPDFGSSEFSSGNMPLEQNVQFSV